MTRFPNSVGVLVLVLVVATAVSSRASIIQTNAENTSQTFFAASSTDLINQGQSTLASVTPNDLSNPFGEASYTVLNNGATGGTTDNTQTMICMGDGDTATDRTVTYTLNTTVNTLGYDITSVQSIAAWPNARQDQHYRLLYSTVAAPSTFIPLGTFSLLAAVADVGTRLTLTDSTGFIVTGVKSIQFNFLSGPDVSHQGDAYRELDVFGAATLAPEPASLTLLAAGGLLLLRRRREHRRVAA